MSYDQINTTMVKWAVVNEALNNPGFKYKTANNIPVYDHSSCKYVKDGAASCIVGRALHALGVKLEDFAKYENKRADLVVTNLLGIEEDKATDIDLKNLFWLNRVQQYQDENTPWHEAVERATNDALEITATEIRELKGLGVS